MILLVSIMLQLPYHTPGTITASQLLIIITPQLPFSITTVTIDMVTINIPNTCTILSYIYQTHGTYSNKCHILLPFPYPSTITTLQLPLLHSSYHYYTLVTITTPQLPLPHPSYHYYTPVTLLHPS